MTPLPPYPRRPLRRNRLLCWLGRHRWRFTDLNRLRPSDHIHCAREGCAADSYWVRTR